MAEETNMNHIANGHVNTQKVEDRSIVFLMMITSLLHDSAPVISKQRRLRMPQILLRGSGGVLSNTEPYSSMPSTLTKDLKNYYCLFHSNSSPSKLESTLTFSLKWSKLLTTCVGVFKLSKNNVAALLLDAKAVRKNLDGSQCSVLTQVSWMDAEEDGQI
ncbi:hypothetical protein PanWU01x14_172010 [Parasponia andersonii]|uniref:Uncharacterized protein n=1 Tax=Parasponia andersonii TaxID=3476 RepID=A0A2P5C9E0_PARAD|nr:hypothetical protein PanWU01x14_172010 [Parasponia andersonii]